MIWLLTTLAALGAAFYIAAPFYREASLRAPAGAPLRARQRELEARRESLLRELKELELDRRMGKVDAEQYAQTRASVTREAAQVLRQIEALHDPAAPRTSPRPQKPSAPTSSRRRLALEIELEVAIARARRHRTPECWACSCGRMVPAADRFCGSCGQARPEAQATPAQVASA